MRWVFEGQRRGAERACLPRVTSAVDLEINIRPLKRPSIFFPRRLGDETF